MYTIKNYWENNTTIAVVCSKDFAIELCNAQEGLYILNSDGVMIYSNVDLPF